MQSLPGKRSHVLFLLHPLRLFSSTHGSRLDSSRCSTRSNSYHGNAIGAYQDLKPKDMLDNNTIAAQLGYLRDLDLRGRYIHVYVCVGVQGGVWRWRLQIEKEQIHPPLYRSTSITHTNTTRISLALAKYWTIGGI